ncbi:hypothetical protein GF312_14435 [Candidatus Poribacteria bacterium]|nr:hypothetical protein [Candidatus Poribacteria bacterium]
MYIMTVMVSTISGHTMMMYLVGALAHPYWFATPENEWQSLFWRYIPDWFTVSDKTLLNDYFKGQSSFFRMTYIKAWLVPMLAWCGFIFVFFSTMLCMNIIIRKRWMEDERLTYPITQLPLEMTQNSGRFFRNKLLWIGFGISGTITLINGLNLLFPSIPSIPSKFHEVGHYFTSKPWNAVGRTLVDFHPFIIGLAFFIPLDLSFSCWFFYLLSKVEKVFASAVGIQNLYLNERSVGAWISLGILALWISRKHLVSVLKLVFLGQKVTGNFRDPREPISYRAAVILTIGGLVFLTLFCYYAGMNLWTIATFFGVYFAMALGITRARAALGPPYHEVVFVNPRQFMTVLMGSRNIGANNLTIMSFLYPFTRCHRSHPMPSQLESLKIAQQNKMLNTRLVAGMMSSIGVGAVVTFISYLTIAYKYGASAECHGWLSGFGWEAFNPLQSWLNHPTKANTGGIISMVGNSVFVFFLMFMRRHFTWWPFHPGGYVLSGGAWSGMLYIWNAMLISWAAKYIILKYGGLKAYRTARPFFFGLVLGDYIIGCAWNIFGLIFNTRAYSIW